MLDLQGTAADVSGLRVRKVHDVSAKLRGAKESRHQPYWDRLEKGPVSYDIDLVIDTGAGNMPSVCDVGNYTSNVSAMWHKALWEGDVLHEVAGDAYSLKALHGKNAGDCIQLLERAIRRMEQDGATYVAMNPDNGWGTYEGALEYLKKMLYGCRQHPKCTIDVSC